MKIRQLFDHKGTSTLTYIVWDCKTMEGAIIDSVFEHFERDSKIINEIGVKLKYTIDTHIHADHITGAKQLAKSFNAQVVYSIGAKEVGMDCADIYVETGDTLTFGRQEMEILETPGHTTTCMAIIATNASDQLRTIFTGDTLMHRATGRTDFQGGSPSTLFDSVTTLYRYPDNTVVMSSHDYNGLLSTTIGECKKHNASINSSTTMDDFIKSETIANKSKLPPARMDTAVPGCMKCGDV